MLIHSVSEKPDADLHVIGFPGAGGSRAHFTWWDDHLGPRVRLSVVDPWLLYFAQEALAAPAHPEVEPASVVRPYQEPAGARVSVDDSRAVPKTLIGLSEVAALLVPELSVMHQDMVLAGHSRGALLAYEAAQHLTVRGHGDRIRGLVAMAHRAPISAASQRISAKNEKFLRRFLQEAGGTAPEVFDSDELMKTVLERLRSELAMSENYRHSWPVPLNGSLGIYMGRDDTSVPHTEIARWRRTATETRSVRIFPGGHFFPFGEAIGEVTESLIKDFSPARRR